MAGATPLTIKDVSLMLRTGYSSESVLQELSNRRFVDTLDSTSEKQLVQAGANQTLIAALRSGAYQLSANEIAAAKTQIATRARITSESSRDSTMADGLIKNQKAAAPPNPPREQQVGGTIYDHLKDDLVYWHEGSLVPFDDETLQKKKFYLLFFSAIWSKEGRQFTPQLVDYYNRIHPQHPEFELVFFSADRSEFAMENYISQTNMPWPTVALDKREGKAGAFAQGLIHQIPRLILTENSGRILSDSGDNPADFNKVLADLDKILGAN
jgi:Thioredoxin-like